MAGRCSLTGLTEVLVDLRTQEAQGQGTDVRLVLLEAIVVDERLQALDEFIVRLAGGAPGLSRGLCAGEAVIGQLAALWEGIELEEQTVRLRELSDLLTLLIPVEED